MLTNIKILMENTFADYIIKLKDESITIENLKLIT
jgi:hypothetical protein